jgi:hypothetical protein
MKSKIVRIVATISAAAILSWTGVAAGNTSVAGVQSPGVTPHCSVCWTAPNS